MFITPSFKKSLIVEQFQGNYLKCKLHIRRTEQSIQPGTLKSINCFVASHSNAHWFNNASYHTSYCVFTEVFSCYLLRKLIAGRFQPALKNFPFIFHRVMEMKNKRFVKKIIFYIPKVLPVFLNCARHIPLFRQQLVCISVGRIACVGQLC